jgi:hypothetical protein
VTADDACNKGMCIEKKCQKKPTKDRPCDDGKKCTKDDKCNAMGMCMGSIIPDCCSKDEECMHLGATPHLSPRHHTDSIPSAL